MVDSGLQKSQSVNRPPKRTWHWLPESQLIKHKVTNRYFIEGDYDYDHLRFGYLIDPTSRTYTLLSLKGCTFKGPKDAKF